MALDLGGLNPTSSGGASGASAGERRRRRRQRLEEQARQSEREAAERRAALAVAGEDPDAEIFDPVLRRSFRGFGVSGVRSRTATEREQIAQGRSLLQARQAAFRDFFSPQVGTGATRVASRRRRRQQSALSASAPTSSSFQLGQPTVLGS